ncbi:aspartate/glutamate racemase family protein, partial [Haloparvum sedimenti]|uniref:aspartate/glutamate racemase family protein n=1 Tax=Haloparvum sedimenti TaxID=1678448 RepID=UPI0009B5D043
GATVHFLDRLVELTPAERDQDHIETLVYNDPTIPDRTEAILGDGPSPELQLIENAKILDNAGCNTIVIDSNTTHYYHNPISESVEAKVPHLMNLVEQKISEKGISSVGVLTTEPAIEMNLYENVADEVVYPRDAGLLMDAMYSYKSGEKHQAKKYYNQAVKTIPKDVDGLVVGCTDFSALSVPLSETTVDALDVLVQWCIKQHTST